MNLTKQRVLVMAGAAVLAVAAAATPAAAGPGQAPADQPDGRRSPAPATAQPAGEVPDGFASWAELFAVQDRLNAAADRIVAAHGAGYAGIVAAPANRALRVYWKGEVPSSVRQLAGQTGVPVDFRSARFSEREMMSEVSRLTADKRVTGAGPQVDGSGVSVRLTSTGRSALRAGTFKPAAVPWQVETAGTSSPVSRDNDWAPYGGGARFYTNVGCSTGFGISYNGVDRMLSAGHCGENGQTATDWGGDPAVDTMGTVFNDNNTRDTLMIDARSLGAIYVGPYTSTTWQDVTGTANDYVGNVVCTGGGRTGEHCGMTVTAVNLTEGGWTPLNRAAFSDSSCAVAQGDSGGPVFHYSNGNIVGRGTISRTHLNTASCPNATPAVSGNDVYYAPLTRPSGGPTVGSLQYYGASLL